MKPEGLTAEQENKLRDLIGHHGASANNLTGVSFYFDEGERSPYRICDSIGSESFKTYDELIEATIRWRMNLDLK